MFDNIGKNPEEQIAEIEPGRPEGSVFLTAVLNSLHEHVAVIDRDGDIIAVNEAWRNFARRNNADPSFSFSRGTNYLDICRDARGEDSEYAVRALEGIEGVLAEQVESFEMEYPCSSPEQERWFLMSVVPLRRPEGGAVVTHSNITRRKEVEEQLRRSERYLKESHEEYQALARRMISAREDARRRLARELHDSFSQRLAMISMLAAGMELEEDINKEIGKGLGRIKGEIAKLSEEVHDIARQLHPRILEDLGLRHAVESMCELFSASEGIPIELNFGEIPEDIQEDKSLNIYRVVQESISNVSKHAQANRIWIDLGLHEGALHLSVRDNGKGFDPEEVKGKRSLGLVSMRERAALIGGTIRISSVRGEGTDISLQVPLKIR